MTPPPAPDDRRSYDLQIAELQSEVVDLKDTIKAMRADIHDLIYAWNTAKGVTSFVKWLGGVITACAVVYAFMKGGQIK